MLGSPAPMLRRDDRWWVDLFRTAGYARSGQRKAPPAHPVRLYRGAPDYAAPSMAWTPSRALALRYASQDGALNPAGRLWSALVEPDALLAAIDLSTDQLEIVVDPRRLGEVTPAPQISGVGILTDWSR